MDRWKSRGGKSQKRREEKRRDEMKRRREEEKKRRREEEKKRRREEEKKRREEEKKRKSEKKEDAGARKGSKVAKHSVFPMVCGSGGSKSRLAKAAGAEPAGQMRDEKLHAVVAWSTFASQNVQNKPGSDCRNTFGSWDVEKSAARSTFPSQNVQSTPGSEHFWRLWCRKSARRCGWKHMSKSKCTRHIMRGPQKVHAVVARSTFRSQKVLKADRFGALLDVQMWFCVAGARDCAPCQKRAKREGFVAVAKTMAGVGHFFPWQAQYKRHVHQRC